MPRFDLLKRPQPFIGLLLAGAGWALAHQVGSDSVFDDCTTRGGGFVVLVSLIGLAITVVGGVYGMRSWRRPEDSGRSFLGLIAGLLALLLGFALALQIAAGLVLPPCAA